MDIELFRIKSSIHSVMGKLSINGIFNCFTVERPYDAPDWKPIPEGKYPVHLYHSPRFNRVMPHIDDVPGRVGILIHWGNSPKDSEGCVIVGNQAGEDAVWESKVCFESLLNKLMATKEPIFIMVKKMEAANGEA